MLITHSNKFENDNKLYFYMPVELRAEPISPYKGNKIELFISHILLKPRHACLKASPLIDITPI